MFIEANKFDNLLYTVDDEGNDNDCIFKYYHLVKRLYGVSFNFERVKMKH